jgi:hypothetical protein
MPRTHMLSSQPYLVPKVLLHLDVLLVALCAARIQQLDARSKPPLSLVTVRWERQQSPLSTLRRKPEKAAVNSP